MERIKSRITILIFKSQDKALTWLERNDSGTVVSQKLINDLNVVPPLTRRDRLFVLIPGQHAFVTTINMPKMNRCELDKAVSFALE